MSLYRHELESKKRLKRNNKIPHNGPLKEKQNFKLNVAFSHLQAVTSNNNCYDVQSIKRLSKLFV